MNTYTAKREEFCKYIAEKGDNIQEESMEVKEVKEPEKQSTDEKQDEHIEFNANEGLKTDIKKEPEKIEESKFRDFASKWSLLKPKFPLCSIVKEFISYIPEAELTNRDVYLFMIEYETEMGMCEVKEEDKKTVEDSQLNLDQGEKERPQQNVANQINDIMGYSEQKEETNNPYDVDNHEDVNIASVPLKEEDKPSHNLKVNDIESAIDNKQQSEVEKQLKECNEKTQESNNKVTEYQNLARDLNSPNNKPFEETKEYNKKEDTRIRSNSDENATGARSKLNPKANNRQNYQSQSNEDIFFKGLKDDFLQNPDMVFDRDFKKTEIKSSNSTIKRYVLFNNSETDLKVCLNFSSFNNENCYIPESELEILLDSRQNFYINAYHFVKVDPTKPFDEIFIKDVKCERCYIAKSNYNGMIGPEEQKKHHKRVNSDGNDRKDTPMQGKFNY